MKESISRERWKYLDASILPLEEVYQNRSKEELANALQNGDISSYTISLVSDLLIRKPLPPSLTEKLLSEISKYTPLPLEEVLFELKRDFFPTTYEWKEVTEEELREWATRGLNLWLPAVKRFHEKFYDSDPDNPLLGAEVLGKEGCFFGNRVEIISLDMNFEHPRIPDKNRHVQYLFMAMKLYVLRNQIGVNWQDISQEARQWYEAAANQKMTTQLKSTEKLAYKSIINVNVFREVFDIYPYVKDIIKPGIREQYESLEKIILGKERQKN